MLKQKRESSWTVSFQQFLVNLLPSIGILCFPLFIKNFLADILYEVSLGE